MSVELTAQEQDYVTRHPFNKNPEFEIFLSRLTKTPLHELEQLANDCTEAVINFRLGDRQ